MLICVHRLELQQVRDHIAQWNVTAREEKANRRALAQEVKKTLSAAKIRDEKEALLNAKKKVSDKVKREVAQITETGQLQREEVLKSNRLQAERVKKETADNVVDEARAMFFAQRKQAAEATRNDSANWQEARTKARSEFKDRIASLKAKSKSNDTMARGTRRSLQSQRNEDAAEMRKLKCEHAETYRLRLEEEAALTKRKINAAVKKRFVSPIDSRRMMQHQHYTEMASVSTDRTSTISKEIAQSRPRLRSPSTGTSSAAGRRAALRMSSPNGSPARNDGGQ